MYASFEFKRLTTNFDFTNLTCNLGRGTVSDMVLNFNANAAAILPPAESPTEKKTISHVHPMSGFHGGHAWYRRMQRFDR